MKYFIFFVFLFCAATAFSQSDLEQALNNAEQELYRLEQVKTNLASDLVQKGQIPNMNTEYVQAEEAYKAQLAKTKDLRKQYKKAQRAKKELK